jgi:hypothetical protein
MAPEQVLGESVDGRADLFAAGIVLWESLTGKHLMAADSPAKTLHNLMNKRIPRVSELVMDVPAALDEIVARSLERDLDKRYASAKAMRDALEAFIAAEGGISIEEIGELVSTLFADRKHTVQEQVKAQLAALSLSRTSDPELHTISKTHVRARPAAPVIDLSEGSGADSHPSIFKVVTTDGGLAPVSGGRGANRLGVTALVFVTSLALGVSGLALYRAQHVAPPAPPAAAPVVTVTVSAPPVVTAPPAVSVEAAPAPVHSMSAHAAVKPAPPPPPATPAAKPAAWTPPKHGAAGTGAASPGAAQPAPAADAPRPTPTVSAQPSPQPAETAQGRTFRRDL